MRTYKSVFKENKSLLKESDQISSIEDGFVDINNLLNNIADITSQLESLNNFKAVYSSKGNKKFSNAYIAFKRSLESVRNDFSQADEEAYDAGLFN